MGKRFSCIKDCPLKAYSRTLGRCSIRGQIVAPTIKGGLDAVKWMGRAYICKFDPKRAAIMKLVDEWEATVR